MTSLSRAQVTDNRWVEVARIASDPGKRNKHDVSIEGKVLVTELIGGLDSTFVGQVHSVLNVKLLILFAKFSHSAYILCYPSPILIKSLIGSALIASQLRR